MGENFHSLKWENHVGPPMSSLPSGKNGDIILEIVLCDQGLASSSTAMVVPGTSLRCHSWVCHKSAGQPRPQACLEHESVKKVQQLAAHLAVFQELQCMRAPGLLRLSNLHEQNHFAQQCGPPR